MTNATGTLANASVRAPTVAKTRGWRCLPAVPVGRVRPTVPARQQASRLPLMVATDSAGNIYVADFNNDTIRKITAGGVVTTLAGRAEVIGSADGTGAAARFRNPSGVATDGAGNVYVADSGNDTIRKITPTGVVSTLAGTAGMAGSADGIGAAARFLVRLVLLLTAFIIYVADSGNNTIRKITPTGVVSTLAGTAGCWVPPTAPARRRASIALWVVPRMALATSMWRIRITIPSARSRPPAS